MRLDMPEKISTKKAMLPDGDQQQGKKGNNSSVPKAKEKRR